MTEQEINDFIKEKMKHVSFHVPHDFQKAKVNSSPTVLYEMPDAFTLKAASEISFIGLSCYCDRVRIPLNISEQNLIEVLQSMFSNYNNHEFTSKVEVTDLDMAVPGNDGSYLRQTEDGKCYELRLYAQGFRK